MRKIDARGKLNEEPFDYNVSKNGKVFINWNGKMIMIINEKDSAKLLKKMENASNHDVQLILAKATGNFKHGNEKQAKNFKR